MFRNIFPTLRVSRIPFPVPVFMVLLIASGRLLLLGCFCAFLILESSICWSEIYMYCRSSHPMWSIKIGVLKNLAKFTEKHLHWSLFFNQVAGVSVLIESLFWYSCNYIKKRLQHRCFPVSFAKFLRTHFLQNTSGQLRLVLKKIHFWRTLKNSQGKYWADADFSWNQWKQIWNLLKLVLTANIFKWIKKPLCTR